MNSIKFNENKNLTPNEQKKDVKHNRNKILAPK